MEYKDQFKGYDGDNPHQEVDFGEYAGLEKIWSASDEEYEAILNERFPEGKKA